jgi:filamentous hemagglutinin family protein
MNKTNNWVQKFLVCGFLIFGSTPAFAQITPDNTLGAESSRLTPNVPIAGENGDRIDGGATRGSNLFHSFSQFNIDNGQRVYFGNPNGIQNILTRVTGGQASNILGTLGVDGGANLFLLNPNGILFGQNARLDLRGSFVGSTANAIGFGEQGFFSATDPNSPPLLTVNPTALLFTQLQAPAGITNQSTAPAGINPNGDDTTGLRTADGKSLLLVGGNVNLDGGGLRAYGGRIELAGLSAPGNVGLNVAGNTLSLNVPNDVSRADVSLTNEAAISVLGAGGGDIAINARNLEISSSSLFGGIGIGLGNAGTQAGDITLNATGAITIAQTGLVDNRVYTNANGNGGNINISAGSLFLKDDARLYDVTEGKGNAGNIYILAADSVSLASSDIFSNVEAGGVGKGGNININAGSLSVTDSSQIQSLLRGADTDNNLAAARGDAGNVNIDVRGAVSIAGVKGELRSGINSNVETGAEGNGGNINIKSGTFSLTDGANLDASTGGQGNAGNIFIQASDSVSLVNGGSIYSSVFQGGEGNGGSINVNSDSVFLENGNIYTVVNPGGEGNGGSININTGSLIVNKGGELNATVSGSGNGGNININARERVAFDGEGEETSSRAITTIQPGATGKAGDIQITTGTLSLTNGAFLTSSTNGKGDAGNITIDTRDAVTFDSDGYASSNVFKNGVGKGGDIQIATGTLRLTNGSALTTNVAGQGDAGNITIDARDAVNFDGIVGYAISGIQSSLLTGAVGKAGDIQIATGSLSGTNGASLNNSTDGRGNAGDITVNARDTITFEGGENFLNEDGTEGSLNSSANSTLGRNGVGNGGNIRMNARALFLKNGGQINASSFGQGNAGNIIIDAQDTVAFDGVASDGLESGASTLGSKGNGGDILVSTGNLSLTNGGKLSTFARGNAGDITINASDITFDGIGSNGRSSGAVSLLLPGGTTGKGGDIQITTNSLSVTNGAQLVANTGGQGNGGNITIDARDTVKFDGVGNNNNSSGAYSTVESTGVGNAGNIKLTTGSLSLSNGGQVSAGTFGQGNAGDITIDARDAATLDSTDSTGSNERLSGVYSAVGATGVGKGGNIKLTSNSLSLNNNAYLSTVTSGKGDAGNIFVQASDLISLSNSGYILSNIVPGGVGNSGTIDIGTRNLTLTNGSQIGAAVFREFGGLPGGKGRGGEVRIKASDSVTLSGISPTGFSSGIVALTERGASGDAGNITVNTGNFRVADGAVVNAATFNDGNAGNITINANNFEAVNGGQVANSTRSSGNAGAIRLNVRDSVTLAGSDPNYNNRLALVEQQIQSSGSTDRVSDIVPFDSASGIFANTSSGSTGQGGSIFIDPPQVTIRDGAKISVNSDGTGNAGNITLQAGTLTLDNRASISAQTASSTGGDINLDLGELLLLRRGSQISTTAGTAQAGGDGGNITIINSPFIIALPNENSDITANAFEGRGGNVKISTQGIFGIQERAKESPQTNDITASSERNVQGQIDITQPDVQPTQGLVELPGQILDASDQIASVCPSGNIASRPLGEFVVSGRGSLPPNPLELLAGTTSLSPLATLDGESSANLPKTSPTPAIPPTPTAIVEAQGWVKTAQGKIALVASAPSATPSTRPAAAACPHRS